MGKKAGVIIVIIAIGTFWAAAQQPTRKTPPASSGETSSQERARAYQADLQKMRILVQQMQMNLASLPAGPTPLRHQFELEIEMWQQLITHLERELPPNQAER